MVTPYLRLQQRVLARIPPRVMRLVTTALSAYLGRLGTLVVTLVALPIARHALTPKDFGLWMVLTSLLNFLAFTDLGIGNGVLNQTISANAKNDRLALRNILVTGYQCTLLIAFVLAGIGWLFATPITDILGISGDTDPAQATKAVDSLRIFVILMALNIPASLVQKIQLGMQQGHWVGVHQLSSALTSTLLIAVAPQSHITLIYLILATTGIQLAINLIISFAWLSRHEIFASFPKLKRIDRPLLTKILSTGGFFLALQVAGALAFQSDGIVITRTLGLAAYGDFALTQRLYLIISVFLSSTLLGIWPTFGDLIARQQLSEARRALMSSLIGVCFVAALASLGLSLSMPWLFQHWLRSSLQPSIGLLIALSAWTVMEAVGTVSGTFLNAANLLRPQVLMALMMACCAFGLKWLTTPLYGPAGAVWATFISYALITLPATGFILRRLFHPPSAA